MAGTKRPRRARENSQRLYIFWYQLAWLGVIAWSGWLVATGQPLFGYQIPDTLRIIPSAVPWYGALGGVLISLVGVHEHRYDWDQRYWTWYVARPFVGAFVAVIAVLIFQSGVLAVGLDPTSDDSGANVPKDIFYFVLAFLTGYREDSFRHLIKRVADVLLTSKDQATPPLITDVDPESAPAGATVAVRGSGFTGTQVVRIGGVEADFKFASDAQLDVVVPVLDEPGLADVTVATQATSITQPEMFTFEVAEPPPDPDAGGGRTG
jgi:hypothetical protein